MSLSLLVGFPCLCHPHPLRILSFYVFMSDSFILCLCLFLSLSLCLCLSLFVIIFTRFTLILVLKTIILNRFMSTGTFTDDEFSWPPHIIGACKTVYFYFLNLLSQLRHFVDTLKCKLFYHAHISPHLTYASTVWDSCSDILFNKLNSLHRRAAKL